MILFLNLRNILTIKIVPYSELIAESKNSILSCSCFSHKMLIPVCSKEKTVKRHGFPVNAGLRTRGQRQEKAEGEQAANRD